MPNVKNITAYISLRTIHLFGRPHFPIETDGVRNPYNLKFTKCAHLRPEGKPRKKTNTKAHPTCKDQNIIR